MHNETKHAGRVNVAFYSYFRRLLCGKCKVVIQITTGVHASSDSKYGFHRSVLGDLPGPFVMAHVLEHRASSVTTDYTIHLSWQTRCCNTVVGCIVWQCKHWSCPANDKCELQQWSQRCSTVRCKSVCCCRSHIYVLKDR